MAKLRKKNKLKKQRYEYGKIKQNDRERAINVTFKVQIYGELFTIKNVWLPKSMLKIVSEDNDIISFEVKNTWFLDKKVKEYCKGIVEAGYSVKHEIKTYLSGINFVVVDWCNA